MIANCVASFHYRERSALIHAGSVQLLETNVPTPRMTARQMILATAATLLALTTAACATKPPAPVEPAPLIKKG